MSSFLGLGDRLFENLLIYLLYCKNNFLRLAEMYDVLFDSCSVRFDDKFSFIYSRLGNR